MPKDGGRLRRNQTRISFGTPLSPAEGESTRRFGNRIETTLATMADESRTDWWTARQRAAAGTTPSPRGPDAAPWRRTWALGADPRDVSEVDEGRWAVSGD
jgi:hypothetical protein